jgi:hypothetical protein
MQTIYVPAYYAPADAQVHAVLAARLENIANAEVWRGGELFGFICEGAFRLA